MDGGHHRRDQPPARSSDTFCDKVTAHHARGTGQQRNGNSGGAAVSYSDCKNVLCREYPDLHELIERLGSRQIRNQGTLGGNVGNASPIGDMPPALIAVNAQLVLRSATGSRTIPVEDYFISYKVTAQQAGEFIESIIVPRAKAGYTFRPGNWEFWIWIQSTRQ